jgi:hypothetical protein
MHVQQIHNSLPAKISIVNENEFKIEASEFNKDLKRALSNVMKHFGHIPIGGYRDTS